MRNVKYFSFLVPNFLFNEGDDMTESEMRRMQEEAVRRAEEMQNRAKAQMHRQPQPEPPPPPPVKNENIVEERPVMQPEKPKQESSGIFEALMKDKERTLILSLILLLMDEKTDNSLILALLYLLI